MVGHSKNRTFGYTIVEILFVIVVLGILAGITYVFFPSFQDRAKHATAITEMNTLADALKLARGGTSTEKPKLLKDVTGDNYTVQACSKDNYFASVHDLPKTDDCWVDYLDTIDKLSAASGMNLNDLKDGDPWGAPYYIDENEGEYPNAAEPTGEYCRKDFVGIFNKKIEPNSEWSEGILQELRLIPTASSRCFTEEAEI